MNCEPALIYRVLLGLYHFLTAFLLYQVLKSGEINNFKNLAVKRKSKNFKGLIVFY